MSTTPVFDAMLRAQQFDAKTCFWLKAFLGRCLTSSNNDDWGVVPILWGGSAVGKSTLINLITFLHSSPTKMVVSDTSPPISVKGIDFFAAPDLTNIEVVRDAIENSGSIRGIIGTNNLFMKGLYQKLFIIPFDHRPETLDISLLEKLKEEKYHIRKELDRAYEDALGLIKHDRFWSYEGFPKHLEVANALALVS